MTKKLTAVAALVLVLLSQRPSAQGGLGQARIFFVDVGTGASTLIVSPTGKTLLVDGGPPGSGSKISGLLDTLGIAAIDYTVVTHYHIDHMGGMIEVLNSGRVAGVSYDNGDGADVQPPGTSTSSSSTRGTYLNYIAATGHAGVTRQTAVPGTFLDLGGGMRATFVAAGGHLLSGGSAAMTNQDLNSESISTLIEYNDFDYLVSGDLTGGGSTSTAKTPDVETYVAQMIGDVDVVQLDHHGSTTANNQSFLAALKAEVAFAQTGETNTFGHPNRETVNKYLNTPDTIGASYTGTGVPPPGSGPVFYQNEASPAGDDRVTQQGYTGAAPGNAGQGTVLLATDGTTHYALSSFDDGGARLSPALHTYPVDGVSNGITSDFKPTVIVQTAPAVPLENESVTISAAVNDRESPISNVTLNYGVNGVAQSPVAMVLSGGVYQGTIPPLADGTRVDYAVTATAGGQTTTFSLGYFSGVTPILSLRAVTAKGEPLFAGYAARIRGTVTASGFSAGTNDDYVQDVTGAINVYRSTDTPTPFTSTVPGQTVEASGRIGFNGGRQRLDITESVEKATSPYGVVVLTTNPEPLPATVTIAGLLTDRESFEGQLVSIANCTIVSGSLPATPQPVDTFVTISDGTGTFSLKIDHDTDVEGFTPATPFTVAGIVQQDDYLRPFDSGYNIAPRSRVDLGAAAPTPTALLAIGDARADLLNNVDGTPGADFIPDRLNQLVRVRGTVTTIDFRGGNGIEYYIQDPTGAIDLFNTGTNFGPFAIGDTIEALGLVTQFNGLTELTVSAMSLVSHDTAPAPQLITLSQLANGGGEAFEGQLVRIDNLAITAGLFPAPNASGNVAIADATGTGTLRVDSDTDIDGTATPTGTLSVIGVLGQFSSAPFDTGYQLLPRMLADIVVTGGSGPALTAAPPIVAFENTNVGSVAIAPVTITNNSASSLTLTTPLTITGTDASQFAVGAPGTITVAASSSTTVSVTFAPTTGGPKSATLNIDSSAGSTTVALTGSATTPGGTSAVVISEVRFRGLLGGNDEFVEIYNNSDDPADISGWKLMGSSNTAPTGVRATVPSNVILPGRTHYLFVNTAASGYSGTVPGNFTYATGFGDNGGAALTRPDNTIVDRVGIQTTGTAYREGAPIATQLTTNVDRGYQRLPGGAALTLTDTDNNATDFALTTPSNPQNLVLTASPTRVNFGSAAPGDTRAQTITIKNLLLNPVALDTPTVSGADAAAFTSSAPSTTTVAAGGTATIVVMFQPVDSGAKTASLIVTGSSAGSVTIALSGTGSGGLSVSPTTIDFGTVQPGSSASSTVTITNTDATGVVLTPPFAITGAGAADFVAGAPGASTLDGGSSTSLAVSFQPAAPGVKNAALLITTSTGATRTVALSGVGTCPAIAVSGSLPNGTVGTLYAAIVTATGGDAPYTFTVSSGVLPGGLALSTGGVISGTPNATGTFVFTVQAAVANGCSGTASFPVNVVPAPIVLTAAPSTVNFGIVPVSTTATETVTLTNVSATPIAVTTPFALSGADAARFSVGAPGATTLSPGASTTVAVSFAPTAGGVKNATLEVSPIGGALVALALTGTGAVATPIVISEFRFRGPSGGNDEFVEIDNTTNAAIDISGYTLHGSNSAGTNSTRATVPLNTTLPAHAHYLFVNTAAGGYSGAAPGNTSYSSGITDDGGIALFDNHGVIVDQVGLSAGSAYKEGATLASLGATNTDRSYERKPGGTSVTLQDTDDNATDFQPIAPSTPQDVVLTVTPASLDFGSAPLGTMRVLNVTIKNLLLSSVTLNAPAISGSDASAFLAAAPSASVLAGGATATVAVTFQPATAAPMTADLTIGSDSSAVVVPLSGRGTPGITVPPTLDLGTVAPGASSSSALTIANDDSVPVSLTPPFAISGADAVDFSAGSPAATTIAPGDRTTLDVMFHPTTVGSKSASLLITSANGGSRSVSLSGLSVCQTITVAGTLPAAEFGVAYSQTLTAAGGSGPYVFVVTAGALPDGLVLNSGGALTGTPTALGTFNFTAQATAANGCAGATPFVVSIVDTTPPSLTLPANLTATAVTPAGAAVTFTASASDLVDGTRTVACAPASGSTFAIGTTTVACSASDAHANQQTGSFTVTVTAAEIAGRMVGAGTIENGTVTHEVAFLVQERATGADAGAIRYRVRTSRPGRDQEDRFDSVHITAVTFFNVPGVSPGPAPASGVDTVTFAGTGLWNGHSGYRFDARATDAGEPGRGRDGFAITVRDAGGHIVASVNATISSGNIESLRIRH